MNASVLPKKINIRGKMWTIRWARRGELSNLRGGARGACNLDRREIVLGKSSPMPKTLFHEVLHACFWDLEEDAISEGEDALDAVNRLWEKLREPKKNR